MKKLHPQDLAQFARSYRFAGGRLRRVRVSHDGSEVAVEIGLAVRTAVKSLGAAVKAVRLRLRLEGVEEYRFQKRLNARGGKLPEAKFGYFDGLYYLNLDEWSLQPGEVPGVHDFRASDMYAAGKAILWEELAVAGEQEP